MESEDHDFVKSSNYKLIQSFYASLRTNDNCCGSADAVNKVGDALIFVRSAKHYTSTAASHYEDFVRLFDDAALTDSVRNKKGDIKPVIIVHSDGCPDENIRYITTIVTYSILFCKYKFDVLCVCMTAPGSSCYNEAERVMSFINDWIN